MYIFPTMIDLGLKKGEKWASKAHKLVAQNVLLCNPRITTCDCLMMNVGIINGIPKEDIKKVTVIDLVNLGVMLNITPTTMGKNGNRKSKKRKGKNRG